jgi:hypothetical protein
VSILLLRALFLAPIAVMALFGWSYGRTAAYTRMKALSRAIAMSIPLCWSACAAGTLASGVGPAWLVAALTLVEGHGGAVLRMAVLSIAVPVLTYVVAAAFGRSQRGNLIRMS